MAAFSFVVCFLLLQLQVMIGVFGERYDVTVITDPPHGPFLIGNRINFTCHVYPMPPEPVTYSWHAISRYGPTTLRPRQKTTQYTPYYGDLHFSWFFCKVFSNETLIGVGRRLVEIHGFVFSVEPLFHPFILGSTIKLQVNISNDYSATRYIRTLVWYHNETKLQSSGRVSVLNNGRMIIIRNTTHTDAGNYRVEIASLDFDNPVCDSLWLPLLRNFAAHAPVTFTLTLMTESHVQCCCEGADVDPLQYYPLVNGDSNTLLTISHDTNLSSSWTYNITAAVIRSAYLSSSLSVNGSPLAFDASKFNISQTAMESGVLKQVMNFQYNFSDEGFYIYYLYFSHPYYLYDVLRDQGHRCQDHYYRYADGYLFLSPISFVIFPFILSTYEPPSQINISSLYFAESRLTQLVCTATGGVPDSHNITLFHSSQPIITTTGNKLQTYIANSLFGEITCIVEALYSTKRVSLLMQEKVSFQFLLAENKKIMTCIEWKKINNTGYYEDIKRLFKTVCNCSVDLEHVRVECSSVTGTMLLLGTVTYSDSEGSVTASTLIDKLQVWLLTSTNPVITLQNQSFNLISQCPVRLTSATEGVCSNLRVATSDSVASESATIIGGSFFGGVLTGVLACIVTLCIGFCVLKVKGGMSMRRAGSTSEAAKEEEVVMGTNQAYETVKIRYQSASRSRQQLHLHEQSTITGQEEPVYENN